MLTNIVASLVPCNYAWSARKGSAQRAAEIVRLAVDMGHYRVGHGERSQRITGVRVAGRGAERLGFQERNAPGTCARTGHIAISFTTNDT